MSNNMKNNHFVLLKLSIPSFIPKPFCLFYASCRRKHLPSATVRKTKCDEDEVVLSKQSI